MTGCSASYRGVRTGTVGVAGISCTGVAIVAGGNRTTFAASAENARIIVDGGITAHLDVLREYRTGDHDIIGERDKRVRRVNVTAIRRASRRDKACACHENTAVFRSSRGAECERLRRVESAGNEQIERRARVELKRQGLARLQIPVHVQSGVSMHLYR